MINFLLPSFFIFIFGFFNLLGIKSSLAITHFINYLIGLGIYFFIGKTGKQFIKTNPAFFYWLLVFILIITFVIGYEVKGSKRWLDLYFFNFQASEFFKIFFVLFFADFFSKKTNGLTDFLPFFKSIICFILPTLIIFLQPDLGNALVFIFIYLVLVLFSRIPKRNLIFFGIFMVVMSLIFLFTLRDYQKMRLVSFFNPNFYQTGISYNMIQAEITIGSGKFLGRGLGLGTQSKLAFLPENRTDFAFASLVEQFGFLGGFFVILFYSIIMYFLLKKIIKYFYRKTADGYFNFLFCLGLFSYLFFQFLINVGMNLGLLPIAGIALPLVSYGGSSMVSLMLGLALIP